MPKLLLNEAESFLFGRWEEAHQLERSMGQVRKKYNALFSQVVKAVTQAHPELDAVVNYMTARDGEREREGQLGFGRKMWPEGESKDPPGLWMLNLRLDLLMEESESPPEAVIWIPPIVVKRIGKKRSAVRDQLRSCAKAIFTPTEFERHIDNDDTSKPICFHTLSRREFRDGINPDEGKGFIQAVTAQFDFMAKLIPAIDELFGLAASAT